MPKCVPGSHRVRGTGPRVTVNRLSLARDSENRWLAAAIPAAYVVPIGTGVRRGHGTGMAWGTGTSPGGGQAFVAATPADLWRHPCQHGDARQRRRRVRDRRD